MPNTNTMAAPAAATNTGQNVIFSLQAGSLITLKVAGTSNFLTPVGIINDQQIIGVGPGGQDAVFQVTQTDTDGEFVKVGLLCNQTPYSWNTGGDPDLQNAIGLVNIATAQTFILMPVQGQSSWINITTASSPPPPYLCMSVDTNGVPYLAYGFEQPSSQGVFELSIVG